MRYVGLILASFVVGWYARQWTFEEPKPRQERAAERRDATPPVREDPDPAPAPEPAAKETVRVDAPADTTTAAPTEESGLSQFQEMLKSQMPAIKGWASMQAKQKLAHLLRELGLDEEANQLLEDAVVKEAERQAELAFKMMLGEGEMDENSLYWLMGLPPDISDELADELAKFLSDDEIAAVRAGMKKSHDQFIQAQVDMQIGMMGISDLSDTQRTDLRDVFAGKDKIQEDYKRFTEVMRDPKKMDAIMGGGDALEKEMEAGFVKMRGRMRTILSADQYKKYEAYEKNLVQQARFGLQMMAGMFKKPPAPKPK